MKVKKSEFIAVLQAVKPGIVTNDKGQLEQGASFVFLKKQIITYNEEISIRTHFDIGVEGAVKAEELFNILGKLKKDDLTIKQTEKELIIISGGTKVGLLLSTEIKLPIIQIPKTWQDLPDDFCEHVENAIPVTSSDFSRPILTCVHVGEDGIVEGSDSYRLYHGKCSDKIGVDFLIQNNAAQEMVKIQPTSFELTDEFVHFKTAENVIISIRLFADDKYPNTDRIIAMNSNMEEIEFPKTMSKIIDKSFVFAKRDHWVEEEVEISVAENVLTLHAKNDYGWLRERVKVRYDGELSFLISPKLLQSIIDETNFAKIDLSAFRLIFQGKNWVYVAMLKK